ncbi:MAG TPA: type II secretion system F family protein, partial [Symbiobacteriaceae bacterium]|nr:type II secretion system F family protein [Symbiobacteriaceae bacterium]
MLYRFVGWDEAGERVRGEIDAPSRAIALARLRRQGLLVDRIAPTLRLFQLAGPRRGRLGLRQVGLLCSQLSMLIEGGVPLLQALQVMAAQSKPPVKGAVHDLAVAVEGGRSLSEALALRPDLFPHLMMHVVAVSEVSGELAGGLQMLARQFDREDQIQR